MSAEKFNAWYVLMTFIMEKGAAEYEGYYQQIDKELAKKQKHSLFLIVLSSFSSCSTVLLIINIYNDHLV